MINVNLAADRSLKTLVFISRIFSISFFKISVLIFFFFKYIKSSHTAIKKSQIAVCVLKTSAGNKGVGLFCNDQFSSHFHPVIAVKDLPAVM